MPQWVFNECRQRYFLKLQYDVFNRLLKFEKPGTRAEYGYKSDGLRTAKKVNGETLNHLWDGSYMVAETDGAGAVANVYIRGINLIKSDMSGYYLYNAHGDVVQLADSSGVVTKDYTYDAFGVEDKQDDADGNAFRYCGEYWDQESETVYLRARYYHPGTGRFMSEDPIKAGLNWYTYCTNNPVTFYDPTGLYLDLIDKNEEDRQTILDNMQLLTNHTLGIEKVKVGRFSSKYRIVILEYADDGYFTMGNELIEFLVDSENFIIDIKSSDNGNWYIPVEVASYNNPRILFDVNANSPLPTIDPLTESIVLGGRPAYIGLAHELIHAYRYGKGNKFNYNTTQYSYSMYEYSRGSIFNDASKTTIEELIVIGLWKNSNWVLTENAIRAEHGLPLRAGYLNPEQIRKQNEKK